MERLERELKTLRFAAPPKWLRARVIVVAQNAHIEVLRRRRRMTILAVAIAAAVLLAAVGYHILIAVGVITSNAPGPARQASPLVPALPREIPQLDYDAFLRTIHDRNRGANDGSPIPPEDARNVSRNAPPAPNGAREPARREDR